MQTLLPEDFPFSHACINIIAIAKTAMLEQFFNQFSGRIVTYTLFAYYCILLHIEFLWFWMVP